MKVRREAEDAEAIVTLLDIEPFFQDLLQRIPQEGETGDNAAARARLFSPPAAAHEREFNADWHEYVEPEIRDLFRTAQGIVADDLATLPPVETDWAKSAPECEAAAFAPSELALPIARAHADAWIGALNQARLVIAAKHGYNEHDMDEELPLPPYGERQFQLFQIHFYDYLQEILIQALGY